MDKHGSKEYLFLLAKLKNLTDLCISVFICALFKLATLLWTRILRIHTIRKYFFVLAKLIIFIHPCLSVFIRVLIYLILRHTFYFLYACLFP